MVISGVSEEEIPQKSTAMAPKRSKPLHNFSMPCLKWGNQRFLRCMKVNSNGEIASLDRRSSAFESESEGLMIKESELEKRKYSSSFESFRKSSSLSPNNGGKSKIGKDGTEAKFGFDKMKGSIPKEGEGEGEEEEESSAMAAKPWNLRARRAACKTPSKIGGEALKFSPQRTENPTKKLLRSNGLEKEKERRKFSILLSREEIEDDFGTMTGGRPSRRPKKRAKIVQKRLDMLFPGYWLSEITADSYKVPDELDSKKSKN